MAAPYQVVRLTTDGREVAKWSHHVEAGLTLDLTEQQAEALARRLAKAEKSGSEGWSEAGIFVVHPCDARPDHAIIA